MVTVLTAEGTTVPRLSGLPLLHALLQRTEPLRALPPRPSQAGLPTVSAAVCAVSGRPFAIHPAVGGTVTGPPTADCPAAGCHACFEVPRHPYTGIGRPATGFTADRQPPVEPLSVVQQPIFAGRSAIECLAADSLAAGHPVSRRPTTGRLAASRPTTGRTLYRLAYRYPLYLCCALQALKL